MVPLVAPWLVGPHPTLRRDCNLSRRARQTGADLCLDWQRLGCAGTLCRGPTRYAPEESPDERLCGNYPGHTSSRLHAQPPRRPPQLTRPAPPTAAGVRGRVRRRGLSQVTGIHARANPLWHTDVDVYAGHNPRILVCRRISGSRCVVTGLGAGTHLDGPGFFGSAGAGERAAGPAISSL